MKLEVGQMSPEIELPDQNGATQKLSDYHGKWVLLYFYPQDFTGGCTTEACTLRDAFPSFGDINAVVLGVSVDSVESHKQFADKYRLPFTLLSDGDKKAVAEYGVWREKEVDGKKFMGTLRTSFLVNPEGKIAKIYEGVVPEVHAQEVLKDLNELAKV